MDKIKVDNKELSTMLNVSENNLKKIKQRGQLEIRLNNLGYLLLEQLKEGKKIYYILEQYNNKKELYNNICKEIYKTNKPYEFSTYLKHREYYTINDIPIPINIIANISNVNRSTITKWDNILISNKLMSKDGFYYFCIDNTNGKPIIKQVEQTEYKTYNKNKIIAKELRNLQTRYLKGDITLNQFTALTSSISHINGVLEGRYYFRIKKFKINSNNELYITTMDLIEDLYSELLNTEYNFIEEYKNNL